MIRILYFARLRETLGCDGEQLAPPPGVATVADLIEHLRARGGVWAWALGPEHRLMVAVDQQMARPETQIQGADEVALFPPVTGG
jgi:molybdopterin synthase sulfur carrier subunit